ncbi:hypothetical protein BO82DRAFT_398172 [Aspergillus uvarum CBS 121591]|uniref:Altered inheritance of mitochondria protein 9, mitochondrial n=1 Tax=Aspergillus uvarum CBS 121591 TaxID=1448315 RepID=A0A319CP42_9EURO|nr:hypothetical protein BO82DRAFT_398172 [Aspergillus uvarum CBS 121591]PYH85851.1 hypothetical protein BO82DRAFT_398172 [Aspergillus uvarum CBS 121591]
MTQNCPASHPCLLDKYRQVAPYLLPDGESAILAPYICHSDLNPANIFVADGEITSVIDWQGIWGTPPVLSGRHPSFIRFEGEPILTLPADFAELDSKEHWEDVGFRFPCPLHFTENELQVHDEETIAWNNIQGFWDAISLFVARNGFVCSDMYEEVVHMFRYVRNWGLERVTGKVKERFEHATLMAADV